MSENFTDSEFKIKEVAERIKAVRESIGFSVEEMAEKTGVTVEEYLNYESGHSDFSFTFVYKFSNACGIEMTDLMEGVSPSLSGYDITRKGEGDVIARRVGFRYERLASKFKSKTAEPFRVTIPYIDENERKPHLSTHTGQELDIVVSGTLKVQIGNNVEVLHEGDSIYYNSGEEHDVWAVDGKECVVYAIVMEPKSGKQESDKSDDETFPVVTNFDLAGIKDPISDKFVKVTAEKDGTLSNVEFFNEEDFNFGFDIVDGMAEKCPEKSEPPTTLSPLESRKATELW